MGASLRLMLVLTACVGVIPAQPPIYTYSGAAAGDRLGESVGGAGDVDGDGHADLIVGVPQADDNGLDAGKALVLSGADGSLLYTFLGQASGDQLGRDVGGAGDVNGDGFADVIVGAPLDDTNGQDAGSASVFSGADGSVLYFFTGDAPGDQLGWSVSGAGDVDGDGFADVVVGAPFEDGNGTSAGMARVFSGANGSVLYTARGDGPGDRLGWSVSGAGDVDGDYRDDVIVGIPLDDNTATDSGAARVFVGPGGAVFWTVNGAANFDRLGWSVSCAGDLNGDDLADVVVGVPWDDTAGVDAGAALVLSGMGGTTLLTLRGDHGGDTFGWAVGGCDDVDGDGVADLVTGSPGHDTGAPQAGRASVWSGATGRRLWIIDGKSDQDQLGWSVGIAADVAGDGYAAVIVGAPQADPNGASSGSAAVHARHPYDEQVENRVLAPALTTARFGEAMQYVGDVDADGYADYAIGASQDVQLYGTVRVYSGATHSVLYALNGGATSVFFGYSIGAAGDVDGDGHDDFLTGSQHYTSVRLQEGRATLWSGATGRMLRQWVGTQPGSHMGGALGGLGDIDGDGWGDVFVGVLRENNNTGVVNVYSGQTGMLIYSVSGFQPGDEFGHYGGTVGDVDGDGYLDFVIGAPQSLQYPAGTGYAVVLSGINGRQIWLFNGLVSGDEFGYVCTGAGDVDGDGVGDAIVGAHNYDPQGRISAGMVRVFSGATGAMLYHLDGVAAGDAFGSSVSAAGDANGDGYADFLVGAPGADPGGLIAAGTAYLFSGADGSLLQTFEGGALLESLGNSVTGLPDLNGDGFSEVVVGVPGANLNFGEAIVYESSVESDPGSFRPYGAPCVASNGKLPRIGIRGRPVMSQSFDVALTTAPASTAAWLGLDSARENIPLDFLGAPGCTFWALPLMALPAATDPQGRAKLTLQVPYEPSLLGVDLFLQWILQDPWSTPLPFALSNGGWVTIGNP